MVAVRHSEADNYISGLPNDIFVFLLFGTDVGVIAERITAITAKSIDDRHDPFQLVRLNGDDVADDAGLLMDEVQTIGMFHSRRAIHLTLGRKDCSTAIKILLEAPVADCVVIIGAGSLRGDSSIRQLCSRSKYAAAIECYTDSERDIARIVDQEFSAANVRLSRDAKAALLLRLGADRLSTRGEIEKLILYAKDSKEITEADVLEMVMGASGEAFDDAVDAAFLGKGGEATQVFLHVVDSGENIGSLVSSCIRRALLLHKMTLDIGNGASLDQVMTRYGQHRLPMTRRKHVEAQARIQSSRRLVALLEKLEQFGHDIRANGGRANSIAMRMLWTIAQASRQPGR